MSIAILSQAPTKGADPESALLIFKEGANVIVAESRGVLLIKYLELRTIETYQSLLSAKPKIPIAGLQDGLDGVLGQFSLP